MLERLGRLSATRPWRTLATLLAFIVLAGVIGGPVAGRLDADGGVPATDSESARASAQLAQASGVGDAAGVVLLVRGGDPQAVADELARVPGIARATPGASSAGQTIVTGALKADADEGDVATAALSAFEG